MSIKKASMIVLTAALLFGAVALPSLHTGVLAQETPGPETVIRGGYGGASAQEPLAKTKIQMELIACTTRGLTGFRQCQENIQTWTNAWFSAHADVPIVDQQFRVTYVPDAHGNGDTTFAVAIFYREATSYGLAGQEKQ